jgi:hypothetical protein
VRRESEAFRQGVVDDAYWLREPQPNTSLVLAYQGCVAPEVLTAAGRLAERHRDVTVLAVTSADRLNAGWTAAQRARRHGYSAARSQVENLLAPPASTCPYDNRHGRSSGNARMARLGTRSCADQPWCRAFRSDRNDIGSLRPFRHRHSVDHRSSRGDRMALRWAKGRIARWQKRMRSDCGRARIPKTGREFSLSWPDLPPLSRNNFSAARVPAVELPPAH